MSRCLSCFTVLLLTSSLCHTPDVRAQNAPPTSDEHTRLLLHLDEGEGLGIADASPNRFAGEIHGAQWNVGRSGHGLAFDGSGVYLDVPSHPQLCPEKAINVPW